MPQGHIEKRGKGWRLTIDLGRDPISGHRRRTSITARTKGEAQARARELAGTGRPATNVRTVGQLLDAWLEHHVSGLSPTTQRGYKSKVEQYLRPAFGNLPLRDLTPDRIDALYRAMKTRPALRGRKLSTSTVRRTHAALSGACGLAVRWKWLPDNPCDGARPGSATRPDIEPPSIEEVRRVVAASPDELDLKLVVRLALATGGRRGELCGIQWPDCNLDLFEGAITIRRSIADTENGPVPVEQHRKSRIRTVSIDPVTVETLIAHRKKVVARALKFGATLAPNGYVLSEDPEQATPMKPERITGRWRDAAETAGSKARFHDLRHWSVTQLLAAGEPVNQVADRHGHRSGGAMTLNVYAHALERLDRRAADVIARAIDG